MNGSPMSSTLLTRIALAATVVLGISSFATPALADTTATQSGQATYRATANIKTTNAFALESRPGSAHTIYLDFRGTTLTSSQWNTYQNADTLLFYPFSRDASRAFSRAEKGDIIDIWQRVTEDFAPFDVNVTTLAPTSADTLDRTSADDMTFGTRVIITPTTSDIGRTCNCGGIAWLDSFGSTDDDSVEFAFADPLSDNDLIAQTIAHEVGHSLGLDHQGQRHEDGTYSEYFMEIGVWAPTMGSGIGAMQISQWSDGQYVGALRATDEVGIITSVLGGVADDYTDGTDASTTTLTAGKARLGLISTRTDLDAFQFTVGTTTKTLRGKRVVTPTRATITVKPTVEGTNLVPSLTILNSAGAVVYSRTNGATLNDIGQIVGLSKRYSALLEAGTYYAVIDGVGNDHPSAYWWNSERGDVHEATTAYSDYGSLGGYTITYTNK
jgi:hypothetical protein